MRIRTIKPDFFTDDKVAELPPLCRIFFQGLWCVADREGKLEDRPKQLKAKILPYDNVNADKLLDMLVDAGFIIRYEVKGDKYIQIKNFLKHQRPHHTEKTSIFPACNGELTVTPPLRDGDARVGKEGKGREGKGKEEKNGGKPPVWQSNFKKFWEAYPKKKSKGQAERVYARIKPDERLLATMIATIERAKKSDSWRKDAGKFIPYPATWLNAKGWLDEYPEPSRASATTAEAMRRLAAKNMLEAE